MKKNSNMYIKLGTLYIVNLYATENYFRRLKLDNIYIFLFYKHNYFDIYKLCLWLMNLTVIFDMFNIHTNFQYKIFHTKIIQLSRKLQFLS